MKSLKKSILKNSLWAGGGQLASLLVLLASNIWLARILSPQEFGQVGIVMFFISIANVLAESGFGGALIRQKTINKRDYSTAFITNLILSLICMFLIYLSAGFISNFYEDSSLKNILIASSSIILINALQITQNAKIVSELNFKRRAILRFISVIFGSIIGISSAYSGLGVWSLVFMTIASSGSLTLMFWISEGFFFSLRFSKKSFQKLYSFGINTTLASLLNTAFDNIYQLILGRFFSIAQVGNFYQSKKLQDVPGGLINMISQNVVYSSLTKLQDDKAEFMKVYNQIALIVLVIMGFVSGFLYLYSEQIILLLYGPKWIDAVVYMQLLTIASFFIYQELLNRVIFKVFDKTSLILKLELIKKGFQTIGIIVGIIYLDIFILMWGFIISSIIGYIFNLTFSRKILQESYKQEFIHLIKVSAIATITVLITYQLQGVLEGSLFLITIPLFTLIYLSILYVTKTWDIIKFINNV